MTTTYGTTTSRLVEAYLEEADAPYFLSGFFQSPPRNFHTTEEVTLDVERDDEAVAIVVQDVSAGARKNISTKYTNKGFTPPIFDEEGVITAYNALQRAPGQNPFEDPNYVAQAIEEAYRLFRKLEKKIRRAIELMASQVLQTGQLTQRDAAGASLYALDFAPKASHFATVTTSWGVGGAVPLTDLENLAVIVRRDGKKIPKKLVFGSAAWRKFKADTNVQAHFDNRRMVLGEITPDKLARGNGATFQGWVFIGQYAFEMWTYDGFYRDPQTGDFLPYVGDDNVIMLSEGARLDLTFGAIPRFNTGMPGALPRLPARISSSEAGLDLTTASWFSGDGKHLIVSAGTRPLTIPTAIDTFGCLDTTV